MYVDCKLELNLESERNQRPLNYQWLKRDYLTLQQFVLIYYGIEPFDEEKHILVNSMYTTVTDYIKAIDHLQLYGILSSSEFMIACSTAKLAEYIDLLREKIIRIPTYLVLEGESEVSESDTCSISKKRKTENLPKRFNGYRPR